MRNRFLFLISTLLLVSCWGNKTSKQQQTEVEGDSVQQTEKIVFYRSYYNKKKSIFDSELPNYSINIEVKYADGKSNAAKLINQQLVAFLFGNNIMSFEDAKNHFADSLSNDYEKELRDFYDPYDEYQDIYAYEYNQTGSVSDDAPEGIIAYKNRIEMYTGGAHGGAMENYINFNEKSGKAITCQELFGDKQEAVKKLIKEQIVKDNECKTAAELEEKRSIFSLGDVYISDNNFLIEKDGILFCYNPYDIAPWSEGFIFAKISYQQLEGKIRQNLINK
ncbi:MAG: DUF3298 domain-containing protein [Bacteroidaceae bacterium]|nr:DUF3298 domain-containing protein [Bacteroidaceae bacterium]